MKFQSIIMAVSAASMAVACPTKNKSKTSTLPSVPAAVPTPAPESTPAVAAAVVPTPSTKPSVTPTTASSAATSTAASSSGTDTGTDTGTSTGNSISGEATFYGGNLSGGTCSFTTLSTIPNSMFGTAYSGAVWDNGAMCGACVKVTRGSKSITAMIVDECPECEESHLDLFEDGFLELGTASEGIIDISYEVVDCGITTPLTLHSKSGTSKFWFSMQVVGANGAVDKLEVSTDGGSTWQSTTRQSYNYFEQSSGFGTDTVSVRVTGADGKTVVVDNVSVASEAQTKASANV